ncbi:MAG: hypothetical protein WDN67_00860 [Candidatus Moraniibacteriota bacterium]
MQFGSLSRELWLSLQTAVVKESPEALPILQEVFDSLDAAQRKAWLRLLSRVAVAKTEAFGPRDLRLKHLLWLTSYAKENGVAAASNYLEKNFLAPYINLSQIVENAKQFGVRVSQDLASSLAALQLGDVYREIIENRNLSDEERAAILRSALRASLREKRYKTHLLRGRRPWILFGGALMLFLIFSIVSLFY